MRSRLVAVVGRLEQEVRAYPALYDAFYRLLTRSPLVRDAVGRARDRVRGARARAIAVPEPPDDPAVVRAREAAARVRLGLAQGPG